VIIERRKTSGEICYKSEVFEGRRFVNWSFL